jgi:site-specific recombinase XerD
MVVPEVRPGEKHAPRPWTHTIAWCLHEELLQTSPFKNVSRPIVPRDQIQPLSGDQVQAILDAARRMNAPLRNAALILLLVDTGLRVSEVRQLRVEDISEGDDDFLTVVGKGNRKRRVPVSTRTRREIHRYLEIERRGAKSDEPLFASVGGTESGTALGQSGVHDIIAKAGKAAHLPKGVHASPHTLRHTFAVSFLRGGGNVFELKEIMGHTTLVTLNRYVTMAAADIAAAHQTASPVKGMRLR